MLFRSVVQTCVHLGIPVDAIPGASAPMTLGTLSGFPLAPWTIHGFPPQGSKDRTKWLSDICNDPSTVTFFEAPHRIGRTLSDLSKICGTRPIVVGRELTKLHQTVYRGSVRDVSKMGVDERGEFTLMLGPIENAEKSISAPSDGEILREFGLITEIGSNSRRDALKMVADKYQISPKLVYAAIERAKLSGE